jgi:hypothetical protein
MMIALHKRTRTTPAVRAQVGQPLFQSGKGVGHALVGPVVAPVAAPAGGHHQVLSHRQVSKHTRYSLSGVARRHCVRYLLPPRQRIHHRCEDI